MKILDHIERWNIWRKHSLDSPVHKLLVLFGLYSPTFQMIMTKREQKEFEEEYMKLDPEADKQLMKRLNQCLTCDMDITKCRCTDADEDEHGMCTKHKIRKTDLTELNKLELYLKAKGITYKREDNDRNPDFHQIVVFENGERKWDAVCHYGSYGHMEGLLEIMGTIVDPEKDGDSVAGNLTADDVIKRIEGRK